MKLHPHRACLRGSKFENRMVSNLVNMVCLNPESLSRYDMLYDVGGCHTADTRQKETDHGVLFKFLAEVDAES